MRLKEILQAGIWRERVSSEFYKEMAKKAPQDLKLLLDYLSMEEKQHEKYLKSLYRYLFKEEPEEIEILGDIELPDFEVKTLEELIEIGIEKEKESKRYYMELFCQIDSWEERERIVELINFEDDHVKKLERAKNKEV